MQNKIKNRKSKCHIRTCSGYPEKWIHGINPRMTECEQGRSMVEMLGVLAVMGVLSVGGVAMYTNAMNKYRANELLNESSKRAVVIATQILSGKSVSSDMINQFDNNGTTFTGVEAVGTNQFKLTLSGVDDDVCTQLKATVGSNTIIQEVGDKCAYLTFNNDLSKGTSSSNTGTGGNEQQEPEEILTCTDSYPGTSTDGLGGYAGLVGTKRCYCEQSDYTYNEITGCSKKTGTSCYSYKDCNKGEYCQFSSSLSCSSDTPQGICTPLTTCQGQPSDKPFFVITCPYQNENWWTAADICQAYGAKIPSMSDLGCTADSCDGRYIEGAGCIEFVWTTDMKDSCSAYKVYLCSYSESTPSYQKRNDVSDVEILCKK